MLAAALTSDLLPVPPGRLGPMVTCTLKLGISILNGGNVQVQQVRGAARLWSAAANVHAHARHVRHARHAHPLTFLPAENAGLPEGEKRCRFLQESVGTDAVLQVRPGAMARSPSTRENRPRLTCGFPLLASWT